MINNTFSYKFSAIVMFDAAPFFSCMSVKLTFSRQKIALKNQRLKWTKKIEAFFSRVKQCAQNIFPRDNIVQNLFFPWKFSEKRAFS